MHKAEEHSRINPGGFALCTHCGAHIDRVPGGQGPVWVHTETRMVTASGSPRSEGRMAPCFFCGHEDLIANRGTCGCCDYFRIWLTVREEVRAAEQATGADEDEEMVKPSMRIRILHETSPVKEGYSYRIDDGSREVKGGTSLSIVEVYDAHAVSFVPSNQGMRLHIVNLEGVRVRLEGVSL